MSEAEQPSTRDRIVREATRLFAEQGIKATTIAQLESAVGLRPGSGGVHRYFKTKDDLVQAVLDKQLADAEEIRASTAEWPRPGPDEVAGFLQLIGSYTLDAAEHAREVTLISLREGQNLVAKFPDHGERNFDLSVRAVAEAVESYDPDPDIDAEALGFLFMGPLLYHKIIGWVSGRNVLGISDERLVAQWVKLFEPVFREIVEE